MKVLHITDPHLKGDPDWRLGGLDPRRTYDAVLGRIGPRACEADLILATGDIGHDGDVEAYRRFHADFEAFGRPVMVLPGNHDDAAALAREFPEDGLIAFRRELRADGWRFLGLNSQIPGGAVGGRLGEEQLQWLAEALEAEPGTPTLVTLHHHPVEIGAKWLDAQRVEDGDAFLDLIGRHPQVRVVLWGHIHQEIDRELHPGGPRLLATPSTSIQFKPRSEEFSLDTLPPGVRWLSLGEDGTVGTEVERIDGEWLPDPAVTGYD